LRGRIGKAHFIRPPEALDCFATVADVKATVVPLLRRSYHPLLWVHGFQAFLRRRKCASLGARCHPVGPLHLPPFFCLFKATFPMPPNCRSVPNCGCNALGCLVRSRVGMQSPVSPLSPLLSFASLSSLPPITFSLRTHAHTHVPFLLSFPQAPKHQPLLKAMPTVVRLVRLLTPSGSVAR